jgi:hypothetical protein
VTLLGRRSGRRTVPNAWLRSLAAADPWLPRSLELAKVEAFAAAVDEWVRSCVVGLGQARLCVRIHEPLLDTRRWEAEALAQDVDEPSLLVPLGDVCTGTSPFGGDVIEELLAGLGRMARIAPELGGLLDCVVPDRTDLDGAAVVELFREHVAALADAGVAVLLPSWWTNRCRLGLRARTTRSTKTDSAVAASGFGFDSIVKFTWQAALGDQRLTKADLAALRAAGEAKRFKNPSAVPRAPDRPAARPLPRAPPRRRRRHLPLRRYRRGATRRSAFRPARRRCRPAPPRRPMSALARVSFSRASARSAPSS